MPPALPPWLETSELSQASPSPWKRRRTEETTAEPEEPKATEASRRKLKSKINRKLGNPKFEVQRLRTGQIVIPEPGVYTGPVLRPPRRRVKRREDGKVIEGPVPALLVEQLAQLESAVNQAGDEPVDAELADSLESARRARDDAIANAMDRFVSALAALTNAATQRLN